MKHVFQHVVYIFHRLEYISHAMKQNFSFGAETFSHRCYNFFSLVVCLSRKTAGSLLLHSQKKVYAYFLAIL